MEILKPQPNSQIGIYAISKPVKKYSEIKNLLPKFIEFVNEGKFRDKEKGFIGVHHSQLEEKPFSFFILNKQLVGSAKSKRGTKDNYNNFFFPSQVIINPEILEAPEKIDRQVPKSNIVRGENGQIQRLITYKTESVSNKISIKEGCISFPHKDEKYVERYFRIKVRYQIVRKLFGIIPLMITKIEWCEGLKAHAFQHEIDHSNGKNIYYGPNKS